MNNVSKSILKMGLLSLLSVMPLAAQIDNGVDFTASFPFYAGDAKLPAGNYKVFQPDVDVHMLQIQNIDSLHSVFVDFIPTESASTSPPVCCHLREIWRYGLSRIECGLKVRTMAIKVDPSQVEREAAADANATQHATAASGQ